MRQQRRALTFRERHQAALRLARFFRQRYLFRRHPRIGLFFAADGELDPILAARSLGHARLYLPVLHPLRPGVLVFARWNKNTPLKKNRYGIAEPAFHQKHLVSTWTLDQILMPLVAFDAQGNRLGMGGGFYDRTLAHRHQWPRQPQLTGIAYRFQQVSKLEAAAWDVPLDDILCD